MREIALDIHVKKAQFQKEFLDYMNDNNQSTDSIAQNGDLGERKSTSDTKHSSTRNNDADDI